MKRKFLLSMLAMPMILCVSLPARVQKVQPVTSLPTDWVARVDGRFAPDQPTGDLASADVLAGEDALSEVSIDVNPTNRDNQVIIGHSAEGTNGFETMNTFYTTDGGLTWTPVPLGDAADGLTSTFRFDPTVAFDDNGIVYVGYGAQTPAPISGTQTTLVVCSSTDGGVTYPQCTWVDTNADLSVPGNDKWHLATGPDPSSPMQQNVYIAWTQNVTEATGTDQRIVVSGSTDGGATFSSPLIINDGSIAGTEAFNLFADPAVGPNGELYVAWHDIDDGQVWVDVSLDGGSSFGTDNLVTTSGTGFKTSIPAQPDRGVHVGPTIDTDRSGGSSDGRLYLTYTDLAPGGLPDVDVLVMFSDNGGLNWSVPVIVHDDVGSNSQFLPWLDVDQVTGLVTTVWYDARNDANNKQVEVFLAVSNDGGATWQPNVLVSDDPSDQSTDNADRYPGNFLEYIGVASLNGVAFPAWADNSASPADLDYFTDQVPIGSPPVADAGDDQTVECAGVDGATVTLDGSGSFDPDGDPLTYTWSEGSDVIAGPTTDPTADVLLDLGVHTITLLVDDGNLLTDTDDVEVTVEDTVAPTITVAGEPIVLWPPNHKYQMVAVSTFVTGVSDSCDNGVTTNDVLITSASSDEPEDAQGDGSTLFDIVIQVDCRAVNLRQERQGGGNGRVYTLNVGVADASGNEGTNAYQVVVPHDQNSSPLAVDDGPTYVVSGCSVSGSGSPAGPGWFRFKKHQR